MMKVSVFLLWGVLAAVMCAQADIVWQEDFFNLDDWAITEDPSGTATMIGGGVWGILGVGDAGTMASFSADARIPFDPNDKVYYSMGIHVSNVTSVAGPYHVILDQYDSENTLLGSTTIFTETAFFGVWDVDLSGFSFDPATETVGPRIEVHSDTEAKEVWMGRMAMNSVAAIPEPASAMLMILGSLFLVRRRLQRT